MSTESFDFISSITKRIIMKRLILILTMLVCITGVYSQNTFTREQVLNMSMEELSDLSLEDLMAAVDAVGVSSADELFALIMNKNVSSASKKEEDSFKSPLSSSVLTKDEIRTYGCLSIEEALRLIPGVVVSERANGMFDVQLRGLSGVPENNLWIYHENTSTLLMIDGRPVFNYSYGVTLWESLPISIEDVNRIEIVRGPSSALYGSNAVAGVINIITEKGNHENLAVSGAFSAGSKNTFTADVAIRKSLNNKWHFGITGNIQNRNRGTDKIHVMERMIATGDPSKPSDTDLYEIIDMSKFDNTKDVSELVANGAVAPFYGGEISIERMRNIRQLGAEDVTGMISQKKVLYELIEPESPIDDLFEKPSVARENYGINGYMTFNPNEKVNISLTGGYQNSLGLSSPATDEYFALSYRTSKTGYINMNADIYGIVIQANYFDGNQDFNVGSPAFHIHNQQFNGSLEYDWTAVKGLSIRPGLTYQWNRMNDSDYFGHFDYASYYNNDKASIIKFGELDNRIPGFLEGAKTLDMFSATLRADYQIGGFRAIAALRFEKPNMPDKWYPTWQFGASYSINDDNFVRLSYSRANRSSVMVNTSSNYLYHRTGLNNGIHEMSFEGNPDADVMQADNIELGYRWRPANNVLIDAEAFYSKSWDYGALMVNRCYLMNNIQSIAEYVNVDSSDPNAATMAMVNFMNSIKRKAVLKYTNLDAEVKQFGISMNVDWIISDKLIAKAHANIQKTDIYNFYNYSQANDISQLITESYGDLQGYIAGFKNAYAQVLTNGGTEEEATMAKIAYLNKLFEDGTFFYEDPTKTPPTLADCSNPENYLNLLAMGRTFSTANEIATTTTIKSNSLPSFYGTIGLIYKPTKQLSLAAYGYYTGERSYATLFSIVTRTTADGSTATDYNEQKVNSKFNCSLKLGYKPTEQFEISFNARNLFNDKSREFAYTDRIGGLYSIGIDFNF